MPFVSHSLAHVLSLAPVPWGTLCKDWKAAVRTPPQPPVLQDKQAPLPHPLLRARCPATSSQPLQWPLQNPRSLIISLNWGDQNWTPGYKCDLLGAEQNGIITSLDVLAALLSIHTRMLLAVFVARECGWFLSSLLFTRTSGTFWQGCSLASITAMLKAWNNCLVYLNTDYKGNGYMKSAEASKPWCVQRLHPRFLLNKISILCMSLCELVAWNRSLSLTSPP